MSEWKKGIPDIREGTIRTFWCAVRSNYGENKIYHRAIEYYNKHLCGMSDCDYDIPKEAEIISEDDDEYLWTGWFIDYNDESFHVFADGEILAYMQLPRDYKER